ncbi:hypothetical protein EGW08_003267, partial [Elysia chlorotica]
MSSGMVSWLSLVCLVLAVYVVLGHDDSLAGSRSSKLAPLKLTVTPAHITRKVTQHVTLRCEVDFHFGSKIESLHWMRILKKTPGGWSLVAQQRESMGTESSSPHATVVGDLGDSLKDAFLEVKWLVADGDVFGVYVCDALGLETNIKFVVEKSSELPIWEQNITAQSLLDLMIETHSELREETDDIANDVNNNTLLMADLISRVIKLEREMEDHTHEVSGGHVFSPNSSLVWPGGYLGLLMPESGCPRDPAFHSANSSFVKFHMESLENQTCHDHQPQFHLSKPVTTETGSDCFVNLKFCEASGEASETTWPEGSYCVNWNIDHQCPPRFEPGRVVLDQVDGTQSHFVDSRVVELSGTYTYLHFCCKETLPHDMPMVLPTESPFFLYRFGGTCQQVQGMQVTPEYIDIDTEDTINGDAGHGMHADVVIHPGEPT